MPDVLTAVLQQILSVVITGAKIHPVELKLCLEIRMSMNISVYLSFIWYCVSGVDLWDG